MPCALYKKPLMYSGVHAAAARDRTTEDRTTEDRAERTRDEHVHGAASGRPGPLGAFRGPSRASGTSGPLVRAAALLRALASPVRLAVVAELLLAPRCVHGLQEVLDDAGLGVSQPLLSQHLRVLREAGLVSATRRGTEVTYELSDAHVGRIVRDAVRHAGEATS